jgi:hypothetical protein
MEWIRRHLTYANVMATIAVFGMLGGGAYAVTTAKKNSVTSKSVKNSSIKGIDVRDESLTGQDVNEGTLALPTGPKGETGPPGAPGSPDTPQQVLDKLKQVDGSGSDLDADKLDGGHACRTDGLLTMNMGDTPETVCTRGALTVIAECEDSGGGAASGVLKIDTSIDDAFFSGDAFDDPDFDAGDPPVALLSPITGSTPDFSNETPFYAAAPDGSQLSGVLGMRVQNVTEPNCEFLVGALG